MRCAAQRVRARVSASCRLAILLRHFLCRGRRWGIPLACRRWYRVFYSEPALWRKFEAPFQFYSHSCRATEVCERLALLRRVAPQVAAFKWLHLSRNDAAALDSLPTFIAALQPSQLTQLKLQSIHVLPAAAVGTLQLLTRLTKVSLVGCGRDVTAQMPSLLPSGVRSLTLASDHGWLSAQILEQLVQRSELTKLSLRQFGSWPALDCLTRLSRLRLLKLFDYRRGSREDTPSTMHPPEPAAFGGPLGCKIEAFLSTFQVCVGAGAAGAVQALHVGAWLWDDLCLKFLLLHVLQQIAGTWLSQCCFYAPDARVWWRADYNLCRLAGITSMPSLPRLLAAVVPPGISLQRLSVVNSTLDVAALLGCTQLRHLRELCLGQAVCSSVDPRIASGTLAEAVEVLLEQAPQICCLELDSGSHNSAHFQLGTVPSGLVRCQHLTRLVLRGQGLSELPCGDYLTGGERCLITQE